MAQDPGVRVRVRVRGPRAEACSRTRTRTRTRESLHSFPSSFPPNKQFSFPGGIPSHVSPECPGSIHEGGELGYSLSHAFGAAFDNPELIVACVVGDGEAETGPLATAWHSNKFLNPITDGAVLPILHLNGYKIANPAVLARIEPEELEQLFRGYGWTPYFVEGDVPETMHQRMAEMLDKAVSEIRQIQRYAREARTRDNDEFLATDGRVMEMLSEHQCEGWLEGYLLTWRHGLFNCYEAFIHIIDSMFKHVVDMPDVCGWKWTGVGLHPMSHVTSIV